MAGTVECSGRIEFQSAAILLGGTSTALIGPSGQYTDSGNPVTVDTTQVVDLPLSITYSAAQAGNTNTLRWSVLHDLKPAS